MKHFLKFFVPVILLMTFASLTTACGDKDDEPSSTQGKINITNNSNYTINSFTVRFINSHYETIATESKGTVKPKDKISVDIPLGATEYYFTGVIMGFSCYSAYYETTLRNMVLTDETVGYWTVVD